MLTRCPYERSWHATSDNISRTSASVSVVCTYLGVQEVDWNAQEEDENEQGKQLVRQIRHWEQPSDPSLRLTTIYAVR